MRYSVYNAGLHESSLIYSNPEHLSENLDIDLDCLPGEKIIKKMRTGKSGTGIRYSERETGGKSVKLQELVAFAPIRIVPEDATDLHLHQYTWSVYTSKAYSKIAAPIKKHNLNSFVAAGSILALFLAITVIFFILQHKKIKAELLIKSELDQIINTTSDAILLIDNKFNIIRINDSLSKLLNMKEDEIIGEKSVDLIPLALRKSFKCHLEHVLKTGKKIESDIDIDFGDGTTVSCIITGMPYRDSKGNVIGVLESIKDITLRRKAEKAVQLESDRLHSILNNMDDGVYIVDKKYNIQYINPAIQEEFGSVNNRKCYEYFHDSTEACPWCKNDEVFAGNTVKWEGFSSRNNKYYDLFDTPLINQDGTISKFEILHDITTRKNTEKELVQKTIELERSNRDLEQYAYIASHDLQEPLRVISSSLKIIEKNQKDKMDEKSLKFFDFAIKSVAEMKQLINSLLELSRIKNEKVVFMPVDVNKIMEKILLNLEKEISESEAEVSYNSLLEVQGNNALIFTLFKNIILNGIKYRENSKPIIKISCKKNENEVEFCISDNGMGIERKNSDRIFAIFKRLHSRTQYSGSGIGLAICKNIVEIHEGKIWVESEVGVGSQFYFTLKKGT